MRFRILGPLEIWTGEDWTGIGARKWRSVLATLLLNAGQIVSADTLTDALWGDEPPANPANLVSIYVLRLRRLIGDAEGKVIVTRSPGYLLRLGVDDLDAKVFENLVADGRKALADGDGENAAVTLREALGLWRGAALADVPTSQRIEAEAERLGELQLNATELRIEADLACDRHAQVVAELRGLIASSPLRERLWLLLMRALEGAGRRAEALRAFVQAQEVIADQLGVDPSIELRQFHEEILAADRRQATQPVRPVDERRTLPDRRRGERRSATAAASPMKSAASGDQARAKAAEETSTSKPELPSGSVAIGAAPAQAPDRSADDLWPPARVPAQLPADIRDFTGRQDLVAQLCALLAAGDAGDSPGAVPVAVVAGSGGLGKTSLAVHAAHRLRADFPDGQLYVDLLGATTHPQAPADVLARFLRDLGVDSAHVPAGDEERAALFRTRLAGRRVLLLLDNARDAAQVRPLLPGSASCAVLVTARSRMPDLASTRLVDLEVLDDDESLTLFARIVGEARAAGEPEATAEVLVACAGLPLAIRICAARLAARSRWSIKTLAERLRDQHRRLDELRAGDLAVRASFQVSFASLPAAREGSSDPARVFSMLGLWPGPFIGLHAAAALVGEPLGQVDDALEVLVDAHLLESPAPDRYRFHDLLRVYAAERAQEPSIYAERGRATRRVLLWYLHTTDAAAQVISPNRTRVPLEAADADVEPLRFGALEQALDWCEAERPNLVAATKHAVADGLDTIAWQLPAAALSFFARRGYSNDFITTHELALECVRRLGARSGEAMILNSLGLAHGLDMEVATSYFREAMAVAAEIGDVRGEVQAATNLAEAYLRSRRFEEVIDGLADLLGKCRLAGDRYGEGIALVNGGEAYIGSGLVEEGIRYLNQAREVFAEIADVRGEGYVLRNLGTAYLESGRPEHARESLQQAVSVFRGIGSSEGEAESLRYLGRVYQNLGQQRDAARARARAERIFEDLGDKARAAEVAAEAKEQD